MFEAEAERKIRGRGQIFEAEAKAEAKILASRPLWPRGLNITALIRTKVISAILKLSIANF